MRGVGMLGDESRHGETHMATARAHPTPFRLGHGDRKGSGLPATPWRPQGPHPATLATTIHELGDRSAFRLGVAWHERTTRPFVKNLATPNALVV